MSGKKNVYIAYTGGTIGMKEVDGVLVPCPGYLQQQMEQMPELHDPGMPHYDIHEYEPLLDSSNMTPEDWVKIAEDIKQHYDQYNAFIVLHGTDTMAFTAASLSFMLENLDKTVIVSGSQIPLEKPRNDARLQLTTILQICQDETPIPEVTIFFNSNLLRGNRSTKAHADRFVAYESPNFPLLGQAGINVKVNRELVRPTVSPRHSPFRCHRINNSSIAALRLFPGMSSQLLAKVVAPPLQGLILETFGVGNAPSEPSFLDVLRQANDRGVVIVNVTQCFSSTVNQGDYATGSGLAKAGVISGYDMTCEAALTKLFFLFTQYPDRQTLVKEKMQENLRGELTPDEESRKSLARYLPV